MSERPVVPDELDDGARLAEQGAALLVRLSALMRTARTYDVSNQAFQRQLREFMGVLAPVLEDADDATLVVVADYFYLNGVRVKARTEILGAYHGLLAEFERRHAGGLRFLHAVGDAEVERFFQVFVAAEDAGLAGQLPEMLQQASVTNIEVVPASELEAEDIGRDLKDEPKHHAERRRAKKVFWRAMMGAKKIVLRAKQTGRPDLRHAKRLVQPIVDSILKQDYSLVGLAALKDHDEYTYAHCVNVSVMSIGMGRTLGLQRQQLADLGVAGLLHDLGKMTVPGEVLRKPDKLDADEWVLMRRHPIEGAIMLSRMPGLSPVMLDAMRAALEHHMNYNRTGYPEIDLDWGQATVSRIVAMADCFDAITAHRAYHKRLRTPYEALQLLLGPMRVNFDPAVLWSLVRTVGLYPAGTVAQTASHHVVLVTRPNPEDVTRPFCQVLVRPDGAPVSGSADDDWAPMPASERIVRVLQPEEHGHDAGQLLAA